MTTIIIITAVFITGVTIMSFDLWSPYGIVKKSIARWGYFAKRKKKVRHDNKLNLLPFS